MAQTTDSTSSGAFAAALLAAMANPKRLVVLSLLTTSEMAVGALAEAVGLSQSALSQHLSKLRAQGLVSTRRDAQTIYYSSDSPAVKAVLAALESVIETGRTARTAA